MERVIYAWCWWCCVAHRFHVRPLLFPLQQATSDDADGVQCRARGPAQIQQGLRSDALLNRIASAKGESKKRLTIPTSSSSLPALILPTLAPGYSS